MNDEFLRRIARHLMLYGSFTNKLGLLDGKTGVVLFFCHYARYTGEKRYEDFAGELMSEIYREIHNEMPWHFKSGLCGIAYGVEYLARNHFVEADTDDVLENLDRQIVVADVRRISDCSLEMGLKGIASYVISRRGNRAGDHPLLTREYLADLAAALKNQDAESSVLSGILEKILNGEEIHAIYDPVHKIVDKIKYSSQTVFEQKRELGISSGYAGIGLHLMKLSKHEKGGNIYF